jgi:hypothetical protein
MIDGTFIMVTFKGMPTQHVLLDLGANEPMIHDRLVQAGRLSVDHNGHMIVVIIG